MMFIVITFLIGIIVLVFIYYYGQLHEKIKAQKEKELFDNAKLIAMGSMIGNIIHQWRQPLSMINISTSHLCYKLENNQNIPKDIMIKDLNNTISTIERLGTITETFRNFLKEKKEVQSVILEDKIKDVLLISGTVVKDNHINLEDTIDYNKMTLITTIPNELMEVVINIINNSVDAINENKIENAYVRVSLEHNKNSVKLIIEDNAGGIPEDIKPYIFDEYFTTKGKDTGTGLGLYMCKKIITESLNGTIEAHNSTHGAKFIISLPLQ